MYCYLYDDFLQENKRFEKELLHIENRLTDLGISGKISRFALFRNAEEMIRDQISKGVSTVVAVGNDETVLKILDVVSEAGVVFGVIPVGPNNELARLMGIPNGVAACNVLSARRVEHIDTGLINGRRFITGVNIPEFRAEIRCNDQYRVFVTAQSAALEISNLADQTDPCDGKLRTIIRSTVSTGWGVFKRTSLRESVLPLSTMSIHSDKPILVFADGQELSGTRFDIDIEPAKLKVITGKDRAFAN